MAFIMKNLLREVIPLRQVDCFAAFSRVKNEFDFPCHFHEEYELNFIYKAKGAQRIVGNHVSEIDDFELVLVGPNLPHGWFTHKCKSSGIVEVTVQFHRNLFERSFLLRDQLHSIYSLFENSQRGVSFSENVIRKNLERITALPQQHGFESVLELMTLLHDLSLAEDMKLLSDSAVVGNFLNPYAKKRIDDVLNFLNKEYDKNITLADAAQVACMAVVSFSRFFRQQTGNTFVSTLNDIRIKRATEYLIATHKSITDIAYSCGFQNISNFNRLFKARKQFTPKEFREAYAAPQA